jgi:hypothetical protein
MKINRYFVKCKLIILSLVLGLLLGGCNSDGGKADSALQPGVTTIPNQVEKDDSVKNSDVERNKVTLEPMAPAKEEINDDASMAKFKEILCIIQAQVM